MNRPNFTQPEAGQAWDAYFAEVDALLALTGDQAADLADELRMHLADSFAALAGPDELTRLDKAIARLGKPAAYLKPVVAAALLETGTQTYNPILIGRGLWHGILAGSRLAMTAALFVIGYAFVAGFALMAALKPFLSHHVGLLRDGTGRFHFGIVSNAEGMQDVLGWLSIPVSLVAAAAVYVGLTRLLRRVKPTD